MAFFSCWQFSWVLCCSADNCCGFGARGEEKKELRVCLVVIWLFISYPYTGDLPHTTHICDLLSCEYPGILEVFT